MSAEETHLMMNSMIQLMLVTAFLTLLCYMAFKASKWLSEYITKKRILMKLKKYNLEEFQIHFDAKGLPITLQNKTTNKIEFI